MLLFLFLAFTDIVRACAREEGWVPYMINGKESQYKNTLRYGTNPNGYGVFTTATETGAYKMPEAVFDLHQFKEVMATDSTSCTNWVKIKKVDGSPIRASEAFSVDGIDTGVELTRDDGSVTTLPASKNRGHGPFYHDPFGRGYGWMWTDHNGKSDLRKGSLFGTGRGSSNKPVTNYAWIWYGRQQTNSPGIPSSAFLVQEITELRLNFKEEMLNLREEVQEILGGSGKSLFWMNRELIEEVREYKEEVVQQGKLLEQIKSDLATALQKLDQVRESQVVLKKGFDVVRLEVRLISQHKLTWQNTTDSFRPGDFLVDGVYTRSKDESINPIQTTKGGVNQIVSIDLGGFFKIHTVKIWNRLVHQDRGSGLVVYADQSIIGVTSGSHPMYSVVAGDKVYARTIIIRNPTSSHISLREVQVFGSGPYNKEEFACGED